MPATTATVVVVAAEGAVVAGAAVVSSVVEVTPGGSVTVVTVVVVVVVGDVDTMSGHTYEPASSPHIDDSAACTAASSEYWYTCSVTIIEPDATVTLPVVMPVSSSTLLLTSAAKSVSCCPVKTAKLRPYVTEAR